MGYQQQEAASMGDWWGGLTGDVQIFYLIGIVAGVFLLLQLLLLAFGVGMDTDIDFDSDVGDGDIGFLSLRGLTAFFFGFGWTGVIIKQSERSTASAAFGGLVVGLLLLLAVGFIWHQVNKLQRDGSLDFANAVGEVCTVYLPIPALQEKPGKIEVKIQGRVTVVDAYTASEMAIPSSRRVKVLEMIDSHTVLVEPI